MSHTVVGLGAGGHAKGVVEILRAGGIVVAGLIDPREELWGREWAGVPVLGNESLLDWLQRQGVRGFFVGLAGSTEARARRRIYETGISRGLTAVNVQHPRASLSVEARLGAGVQLMAGAIVGSGSVLGVHSLIQAGAVVEQDCCLGAHVQIGTGARIAPGVQIGAEAHIGIGAIVNEGVRIGEYAVIEAGAVVLADVPARATVEGTPARTTRIERATLDA